jgi:site-specific recombinase XerD
MPVKNHLNSQQVERLQQALKEEENGDIRERILILLLLNDGKTQAKIAEFIGCSLNKVSKRVYSWRPGKFRNFKR